MHDDEIAEFRELELVHWILLPPCDPPLKRTVSVQAEFTTDAETTSQADDPQGKNKRIFGLYENRPATKLAENPD